MDKNVQAYELLEELVKALDDTHWSSWQTTYKFDPALTKARDYIQHVEEHQP